MGKKEQTVKEIMNGLIIPEDVIKKQLENHDEYMKFLRSQLAMAKYQNIIFTLIFLVLFLIFLKI